MRSVVAMVLHVVLGGALAVPVVAGAVEGAESVPRLASDLAANTTEQNASPIRDLNAVVVSGHHPGPGLWKVVSDDGHALWVLGTVEPLPRDLQWQSAEVEAVIAQADEVLSAPGIAVYWDLGFFSSLALLPSALRVRRNPDGKELEDVLPADLHSRWLTQKERYLGWELSVERWRPMFAADKLHKAALKKHGLGEGVIRQQVRQVLEVAGLKPTPVIARADVDEPRSLVREYNRTGVNDVACMEGTLRQLEAGIPRLVARANAWATGDVDVLRSLPAQHIDRGCISAVLESDFAQRHGYGDIGHRVRSLWLEQTERALASNAVTFALLPMDEVLSADGMLAALVGRGYRLESPGDTAPVGSDIDATDPADALIGGTRDRANPQVP